jgi:hypothetical protein
MHSTEQLKADLKKWQTPALAAGVLGLAATAGAFFMLKGSKETATFFWQMYLMSFMVVAALTLGSLGLMMIGHLATGRWLHFIQRPAEAAAKNVFYLIILAVGLWFGRSYLYQEWINRGHGGSVPQAQVPFNHADAIKIQHESIHGAEHADASTAHGAKDESAAHDAHGGEHKYEVKRDAEGRLIDQTFHRAFPVEVHNRLKHAYMTDHNWTIRLGAVLVIYAILATLLTRWSRKQQETQGGEPYGVYQRRLSGPGIIIFALAATVLAFDLLVAIDRKWFSSIYGAITFVSFGLTATSFMAMFTCKLREYEPYANMTNRHSHDIGTFMFAFTVLWTYMNAGQLVIIWNGNMIEETSFYFRRIAGNWPVIDWILFFCAFIIPFFLLLNQPLKQNKKTLAMIGAWVFFFRYVDWFWEITPWFNGTPTFHWMMITAPVGMVGIWFFLFLRNFISNPVPVKTDARFGDMLYNESAQTALKAHHH